MWSGCGILVVTGNNPITGEHGLYTDRDVEKDFAGYIGIEGNEILVQAAISFIKEHADYKDFDSNNRSFI